MNNLNAREARIIEAVAQTIFPPDRRMISDAVDADVVGYLDRWLHELEAWERLQIRAMFMLFEYGIAVLKLRPTLRFTTASPKERDEYLRSWMESSSYARRMAFNALRSVIVLAYLASDRVQEEFKLSLGDIDHDPMPHLRTLAGLAGSLRDGKGEAKLGDREYRPWEPPTAKEAPEPFTEPGEPAPERPNGAHVHPKGGYYLHRQPEVREFADYTGDMTEQCDFCIVGSGPGGALVARFLAERGYRVVVVEAGPVVRREEFVRFGGHALSHFYWDSGLRTTRGNVIIPTMQPRALGGGSVLNSAICLRIPDYQLQRWSEEHGLRELTPEALEPHFDAAERFMGIKPVEDDVQGPRNELFRQACEAVGLNAERIRRNEDGCRGSAMCNLGCPNGAKLSTDLRGIPELVSDGGRVYTSITVERLLMSGSRIRGVEGVAIDPKTRKRTHTLKVFARCTILAAGALASPVICQKSGLTRDPIGGNLRMHPATVVAGVFDEDVLPWYGATQGYHSLDLLKEGIKLESLWADAALMAFRVPGMGARFKEHLSNYRKIATWDAWVSGDSSVGRVRHIPGMPRASIEYNLGVGDVRRLQAATIKLSEMFFAVGAKSVYPGIDGLPERIRRPGDLDRFRDADVRPQELPVGSNHVYGGMSMGADPDRYACDAHGKVWFTDDLYVCDTGLYPSTPSANPMFPIMALAHRMASELSELY